MSSVSLSVNTMPMAITSQVMFACVKSNILNPPNNGQSEPNRFLGKPIRMVVRIICALAIAFFGPVGFMYHISMAIKASIQACRDSGSDRALKRALAYEHLKASLHDLTSISFHDLFHIAIYPTRGFANLASNSLIQLDMKMTETIDNEEERSKKDPSFTKDLQNLRNGRYRHDMLIHSALLIKDHTGKMPALDSHEVQELCWELFDGDVYGTVLYGAKIS